MTIREMLCSDVVAADASTSGWRFAAGLAVMLNHGELGAGFGFDPADHPAGKGYELLDIKGYADDLRTGALQCFQCGRDGRAIRRQIGPGEALVDLAKTGVILLVRPEDGHKTWLYGKLLSIGAGNTIVAEGESAATALPGGTGVR